MDDNELNKLNSETHNRIVKAYYFATVLALALEVILSIVLILTGEKFRYEHWLYMLIYIVVPTALNLTSTLICSYVVKSDKFTVKQKRYVLIYTLQIIFLVVCSVHSHFPVLDVLLVLPIIVSSMVGEKHMSEYVFGFALLSLVISSALAPIFDDAWEMLPRVLNSVLVAMIMLFTYVTSRAISHYTKIRDEILNRNEKENRRMRKALVVDSMTGLYNHSEFTAVFRICVSSMQLFR